MTPTARTPVLALFWLLLGSWQCDRAHCENNMGCLFSPRVCTADEDCFDDNAFGRCQNSYEPDLYQHLLGSETLRLLEAEMARLFNGGYRWDHEYTQCVVQSILHAQRHHVTYDPGMCSRLMQMTLPPVPPEVVEELEAISPQEMAFIKFTPNKNHQNSMYADETFSPPLTTEEEEEMSETEKRTAPSSEGFHRKKYPEKISSDDVATDSDRDGDNALFGYLLEVVRDTQRLLDDYQAGDGDKLPSNKIPIIKTDLSSDLTHRPAFTEGGIEWLPVGQEAYDYGGDEGIEGTMGQRSRWKKEDGDEMHRNEEDGKRREEEHGKEIEDEDDGGEKLLLKEMLRRKGDINDDFRWNPSIAHFADEENEDDMRSTLGFNSDRKSSANLLSNAEDVDDDIFTERRIYPVLSVNGRMPTFQRPMRYDTKKPGPTYFYHDDDDSNNSFDFREETEDQMAQQDNSILQRLMEASRGNQLHAVLQAPVDNANSAAPSASEDDVLEDELELKGLVPPGQHSNSHPSSSVSMATAKETSRSDGISPNVNSISYSVKDDDLREGKRTLDRSQPEVIEPAKSPRDKVEDQTNDVARTGEGSIGHFQAVDATHAYLMVEEKTPTHDEGEKLVMHLAQKLKLPKGSFSDVRVDGNQVTFKVDPNNKKINASDVATRAEEMATELKASSGLTVIAAGIGDKVKFEVVSKDNDRRLVILTFVLCGGVVGILIAVAVIYVVRRHARSKEKLKNIAQPETEASQDYQDLCRQRMASKTNEKPEPVHAVQSPKRVRSLSQGEGQASSSSHSSTSSWNEEPVTSNMDISTGHMILSYMEDHLKNKDRLDREWEALCAYEAEPCSTAASTLAQNVKKNRYTGVLPYDHSRVILNELSNVSGSDYINASTITDHDPRNPAYIATQGPLPHTAADFWQMIWEQGSVVMVMLTRLMENGVAMCHRYWPEEGSEVYHIYEVHLVSEHIWCDDYLVRSFYLKNIRTSETRTVTQFHFLSWPDNGVPNSTKALLEFRRKVNKSYRGRSCPIVVHCSDGIGRTGTYCLIDMVLNRMAKGAKEIDIAATLEHIRDQRGGMVKTKAQFEFVLMAIAEEVHAILKALSQ